MPPRKTRNSKRKARKEVSSDDDDEKEFLVSDDDEEVIEVKPKRKKRINQRKKKEETSEEEEEEKDILPFDDKHSILNECEGEESDEFLQAIVNCIKQMKDPSVLGRLFSAEITKRKKNLSIGIVKYLREISDEFLVSISQAEMFMNSCSIQAIDQNNICLARIDVVEVWASIFSFLPIQSFFAVRAVCKLWYEASELPHALTHFSIPFEPYNKSEKLFFDKFISHRRKAITSYDNLSAIPSLVKQYGIQAKAIDKVEVEKQEGDNSIQNQSLESLYCRTSTRIMEILKSPSSGQMFPALKYLSLESLKRVKEITISHPTLTTLILRDFGLVTVSCPMLETCELQDNIENVIISSRMLNKLKVNSKMTQLNLKDPTMLWDATCLENVVSVSQFDCPFLTKAYIGHDCMLKYIPKLTSITLNGEFPMSVEALKKFPSSKQVVRHVSFKNFNETDTLPEKQSLKLALGVLEDVEFYNCSSEFVLTITEVLPKSLRCITMYQIYLTKQICDTISPSSFPDLHSMKFTQVAKSHIKSKQAFEKMLDKLETLTSLTFEAKKKTDLSISLPEHVEELEIHRVSISGDVSNIKRLISKDYDNNLSLYEKLEFACILSRFSSTLTFNKSLKCVESYSRRNSILPKEATFIEKTDSDNSFSRGFRFFW